MRVFLQGENESVVVNGEITVTVLEIVGDEVRLAIDAPEWMEIAPWDTWAELQAAGPLRPR